MLFQFKSPNGKLYLTVEWVIGIGNYFFGFKIAYFIFSNSLTFSALTGTMVIKQYGTCKDQVVSKNIVSFICGYRKNLKTRTIYLVLNMFCYSTFSLLARHKFGKYMRDFISLSFTHLCLESSVNMLYAFLKITSSSLK